MRLGYSPPTASVINKTKRHPNKGNVIKLAVIANQRARWCGNLLLFRGFPRQCDHWLGMTFFLNLMTLPNKGAFF